ncbi:MAG: HAD family hydrolase [Cellulosilyticaceae bacterium]
MNKQYKAVIFDLDGTLIDSMWVWEKIDEAYLGGLNIEVPQDIDKELEGMSFTETATYFKERFQLEQSVEAIKEAWNELAWEFYMKHIPLKDNVIEFLQLLHEKEISLGIATSNSIELVTAVLERFDIKKYFQTIRTSCEVEKGKPHPYIYLKVAEDLGINPEECLVFEDVPNGALAAKRAGMDVWGVDDIQSIDTKNTLQELSNHFITNYQEAITYFTA